ncbi:hypothetical protein A2U01_0080489, partial [Trifolium medium]|nr:hypothetical protein [Trifolium medium]
ARSFVRHSTSPDNLSSPRPLDRPPFDRVWRRFLVSHGQQRRRYSFYSPNSEKNF